MSTLPPGDGLPSNELYTARDSLELAKTKSQPRKHSNASDVSTERFSSSNSPEINEVPPLEKDRFSTLRECGNKISRVMNKIGRLINKIAVFRSIDKRLHSKPDTQPNLSRSISGSVDNSSVDLDEFLSGFEKPEVEKSETLEPINIDQEKVNAALGDYSEIFGGDKVAKEVDADQLESKLKEFYESHPVLLDIHKKVEQGRESNPGLQNQNFKQGIGSLTGGENILYRCMLDAQKRLAQLKTDKHAGIQSQPVGLPPKRQKGIPEGQKPDESFISDSRLDLYDNLTQSKINEKVAQRAPDDLLTDSLLDLFDDEEPVVESFPVENPNIIKREAQLGVKGAKVELHYDPNEEHIEVKFTLENGTVRECSLNEAINDLVRIINSSTGVKQHTALHVLGTISGLLNIASKEREEGINHDYLDGERAYLETILQTNSIRSDDIIPSTLKDTLPPQEPSQPPTRAPSHDLGDISAPPAKRKVQFDESAKTKAGNENIMRAIEKEAANDVDGLREELDGMSEEQKIKFGSMDAEEKSELLRMNQLQRYAYLALSPEHKIKYWKMMPAHKKVALSFVSPGKAKEIQLRLNMRDAYFAMTSSERDEFQSLSNDEKKMIVEMSSTDRSEFLKMTKVERENYLERFKTAAQYENDYFKALWSYYEHIEYLPKSLYTKTALEKVDTLEQKLEESRKKYQESIGAMDEKYFPQYLLDSQKAFLEMYTELMGKLQRLIGFANNDAEKIAQAKASFEDAYQPLVDILLKAIKARNIQIPSLQSIETNVQITEIGAAIKEMIDKRYSGNLGTENEDRNTDLRAKARRKIDKIVKDEDGENEPLDQLEKLEAYMRAFQYGLPAIDVENSAEELDNSTEELLKSKAVFLEQIEKVISLISELKKALSNEEIGEAASENMEFLSDDVIFQNIKSETQSIGPEDHAHLSTDDLKTLMEQKKTQLNHLLNKKNNGRIDDEKVIKTLRTEITNIATHIKS